MRNRDLYRLPALLLTLALASCLDNPELITETDSGTGTSSGTTDDGTTTNTPTTETPPTTGDTTTGATTTGDTTMSVTTGDTTGDGTTSGTTTDGTTTDGTTTDGTTTDGTTTDGTTTDGTTTDGTTFGTTIDETTFGTTVGGTTIDTLGETTIDTVGETTMDTVGETTGTTGEPDQCADGQQNGLETDVDCGGPECSPCTDGGSCLSDLDCESAVCEAFECAVPTCDDGVQNGDELGLDCGGSCEDCQEQTLVINEVDYDQPGNDTTEFIEILNVSAAPVSLDGISLMLVNGANGMTYTTIDLGVAGTLMAGQYLVVSTPGVMVPPDALKLTFVAPTNAIQNGAPDGIALVDTTNAVLLDALSYEGSTTGNIAGLGMVSLVEGTPLVAEDASLPVSLGRLPNGTDTNDANSDWKVNSTPTPGAENMP